MSRDAALTLRKVLPEAIGLVIIIFLISLVLGTLFGIIEKKSNLSKAGLQVNGYRTAGIFKIANQNGEFGRMEKSKLEKRISEDSGVCDYPAPGMREGEFLGVGMGDGKCSRTFLSALTLQAPLYSRDDSQDSGFYQLGLYQKSRISSTVTGAGPGPGR
ncbi:MAG: hypothetical protein ABEJ56_06795 [Candidatus Nanohaloarchaea archaeon]